MTALRDNILKAMENGMTVAAPLGRTRLQAMGLTVADCWATVKHGKAYSANEADRMKFIDEDRIVFVAYNSGQAVLVSAYPTRKPI